MIYVVLLQIYAVYWVHNKLAEHFVKFIKLF